MLPTKTGDAASAEVRRDMQTKLDQILYHDLGHSCASLMIANGVPMKQIQDWLGHSDFSTTANIYEHLEYNSKLSSADAMLSGLGFTKHIDGEFSPGENSKKGIE